MVPQSTLRPHDPIDRTRENPRRERTNEASECHKGAPPLLAQLLRDANSIDDDERRGEVSTRPLSPVRNRPRVSPRLRRRSHRRFSRLRL